MLLLISWITNSYYEVSFKSRDSQIASCDNGIIPRQILVDIIRYTSVFLIMLRSQRLVFHGMPPPPADCLESLDIVMISNIEFIPIFKRFVAKTYPDKMKKFNRMIDLFLHKTETIQKMEFTNLVNSFKRIYEDY